MQEINDIVESFNRQKKMEKKERVIDMFVLARVTANRILVGFSNSSSESDLLQPWDFYPDIFEDKSEELEKQRELIETERLKMQMESRVAAWNKRFEEEHKNGSRETED